MKRAVGHVCAVTIKSAQIISNLCEFKLDSATESKDTMKRKSDTESQ